MFAGIKFITQISKTVLLMVNGYTFHKHKPVVNGSKWRCSAHSKKCRAYVVMSEGETAILRSRLNHNHEMPPTSKSSDYGTALKLKL